MAARKKTWKEKLDNNHAPKVEILDKPYAGREAGTSMYIGNPRVVDAYIRNIPYGTHVSLQQMRDDLAAENHADITCPLTSGIFLRIAAEAAWEEHQQGKPAEDITPFWRMTDRNSPTAKKLAAGIEFIREMRQKEGLPW